MKVTNTENIPLLVSLEKINTSYFLKLIKGFPKYSLINLV